LRNVRRQLNVRRELKRPEISYKFLGKELGNEFMQRGMKTLKNAK
jgi:hypothetical protein